MFCHGHNQKGTSFRGPRCFRSRLFADKPTVKFLGDCLKLILKGFPLFDCVYFRRWIQPKPLFRYLSDQHRKRIEGIFVALPDILFLLIMGPTCPRPSLSPVQFRQPRFRGISIPFPSRKKLNFTETSPSSFSHSDKSKIPRNGGSRCPSEGVFRPLSIRFRRLPHKYHGHC